MSNFLLAKYSNTSIKTKVSNSAILLQILLTMFCIESTMSKSCKSHVFKSTFTHAYL